MPRVVGCSKSACFLCDMFIQRHDKYQITSAHRRIYPKWTIPNNTWITEKQITSFRSLFSGITHEIKRLNNMYNLDKNNRLSAPIESKACLPLPQSSASSAITTSAAPSQPPYIQWRDQLRSSRSNIGDGEQGVNNQLQNDNMDASGFSLPLSQIPQVSKALPVRRLLGPSNPNRSITVGLLTIIFNFNCSFD
jgi:hypothetical protein